MSRCDRLGHLYDYLRFLYSDECVSNVMCALKVNLRGLEVVMIA